jgi:serine protease Do
MAMSRRSVLALSLLLGALAGGSAAAAPPQGPAKAGGGSKGAAPAAKPAAANDLWTEPARSRSAVQIPSVAPLVDRLEPAVLVIFTEADFDPAKALPPGHPPIPEGMPFPMPFEAPDGDRTVRGQGAGFLITPTGYALTNHHVVENTRNITVRVGESHEEVEARVVGSDEKTDIALLQLKSARKDWPFIPLGDSDVMRVGDFVVAIGSPFGLEQSVSVGIISGRSRRDIAPSGREGLYDFMQTDASINPGNSGGPLLNLYGEAIGINSAVNAAGSGIGFAIPINMVKRLLPSLRERGRFSRSWIGVQITSVEKLVAKGLGLDRPRGALVREVVPEGPAARGGVAPGDVIVAFEGRGIEDSYELPLLAGEAGVGKVVKVDVIRDGKPRTLSLTLGEHPDNAVVAKADADNDKKASDEKKAPDKDGSLGVVVVTLDLDDRQRLHLRADVVGTRVTKVRPGSPAFLAGLQADDVILSVNGKEARTASDFAAIVKETPAGGLLRLTLRRGSSTIFIPLPKP